MTIIKILPIFLSCCLLLNITEMIGQNNNCSPYGEACSDSLKCIFSIDLDYFEASVESVPNVFWTLNKYFNVSLKEGEKDIIIRFAIYNQEVSVDTIICRECNSIENQLIFNSITSSNFSLITPNKKFKDQTYKTYLRFLISRKETK